MTSLTDVWLKDSPAAWEVLGFAIVDGCVALAGVSLHVGADQRAVSIDPLPAGDLDGVPVRESGGGAREVVAHPNGVAAVDHFVIVTPDFDRTAGALATNGIGLRRIRTVGDDGAPDAFRQGFRRLGPAILELVEAKQMPAGPARFWGFTLIVDNLDALAERLGPNLRSIKDAVQPGRRIATLDGAAGLRTNVAFMTPEP